jgi:hypothetical protein
MIHSIKNSFKLVNMHIFFKYNKIDVGTLLKSFLKDKMGEMLLNGKG